MIRLLARWLATSVLLLFVVSALTFVLISFAPGDAARAILGAKGTVEQYEELRQRLGLNDPLPERYWDWLSGVLQGDFGASIFSNQPVSQIIASRIAPTLALVVGSLLFSALVGVALGVASAQSKGLLGRLTDVVSLLGISIPNFWLGLVLVTLFAVGLGWLPATGYVAFAASPAGWAKSLILPIVTLGVGGVATIAKQTRDAMGAQLASGYVSAMRAQGLSERSIVYKHALKNAAIPVTTVMGLMFVGLFSGTVLVENVFAYPGLGGLVVRATAQHDIPVVEGVALTFAVFVVLANLAVDLLYGWLNPKARLR
ncbi:MAG: ABC transporter permease [Propionibacteriaceae bacterium]|jgi:peptide/nickel transport system permease protein|nr:ABC transporter permease [Propionibacteriaceae bacterium]